jgi:hypothetical protein
MKDRRPIRDDDHDLSDLIECLFGVLVRQCIDIDRLSQLEEAVIDAMVARDKERELAVHMVESQVDAAWQSLMAEYDHRRSDDCPLCAMADHDAA